MQESQESSAATKKRKKIDSTQLSKMTATSVSHNVTSGSATEHVSAHEPRKKKKNMPQLCMFIYLYFVPFMSHRMMPCIQGVRLQLNSLVTCSQLTIASKININK